MTSPRKASSFQSPVLLVNVMQYKQSSIMIWATCLIPCLVFIMHALLFRNWIVDDAGISFAYARNLSQGYGLVAQIGVAPVEGYSNFLWTVLLAPFFSLRLFDAASTPKLVSVVLVLIAFTATYRTLIRFPNGTIIALFGLTLTALNTSFVVWTTSGLENPLYVMLIALLFALVLKSLDAPSQKYSQLLAIGLLASAIALTRPDGIVYSATYPCVLLGTWVWKRKISIRTLFTNLLGYGMTVGLLFGFFLLLRHTYYGEWLPNTYFAKMNISMLNILPPELLAQNTVVSRTLALFVSAAGLFGIILFVLEITMLLGIIMTRQVSQLLFVLLIFLAASLFVYLYLPPDWMDEYRFATPFFPLFYLTTFALFEKPSEN